MSSVALLAINSKYVHSSLSVWYLAGGISRYARLRHDVKVFESTINESTEDTAGKVAEHMPDIVGIGAYIWNAGMLPELLRLLRKKLPGAVFVLGGPEASFNTEFWLAQGADFVLRGEGERSFPALLDALSGFEGAGIESVHGLCRLENGKARIQSPAKPANKLIDPYSEAYFDALHGRIAYIETSRGCPFRCAFCLSAGEDVRAFPLKEAKEQLKSLSRSGVRTIKFVDRTFNYNAERTYELFEYIISLDTPCCFHFEVAADLFDKKTLALLCTAPPGRIQLEAGLQSYYEPALKAVLRYTNPEKADENIRTLLSGKNIHIHLDLIAGLPFESLSDFQNSFDRAYGLGGHTLQLGFLKLLHGSALREQADNLHIAYDKNPPYEIISSQWLSRHDIAALKQTEDGLQHTYNKGRFLSSLRHVQAVSGLRPFSLYQSLGEAVPNRGLPLEVYAGQVYEYLAKLSGVNALELRDLMICDWLRMVKGRNMPSILKTPDSRRKQVLEKARRLLGRKIGRDQAAVLSSGKGVFANDSVRDPVTGLYQLSFVDF